MWGDWIEKVAVSFVSVYVDGMGAQAIPIKQHCCYKIFVVAENSHEKIKTNKLGGHKTPQKGVEHRTWRKHTT